MENETEQARLYAAHKLQLIIDAIPPYNEHHLNTTEALDVIDAIAHYLKLLHAKP